VTGRVLEGDSFNRVRATIVIKVYENQIERAIKALKRQMAKEGLLKELKRRSFYEKPCVKRKRKQKEARKKRLKAQRVTVPYLS